ncbi:mitochondrial protein FMP32 [Sporothrix brasiliensis 5110]|uniref:Mitochondrial protein FMP32 n=1 Tax=Sporothrix brasiliensis 5110 TaxID=1398154 RepID=A0A0C2IY18_9PEZI|nr:mitochondrial protein FMP32 [Sporothrix brasiliensis 5110]KIH94006.1 mitochondrial protein FMP32 [Sporothrix brasiliensis 5110]
MALQQSLPRFLLPQLSWNAPVRQAHAKPMLFRLAATAAAFSTSTTTGPRCRPQTQTQTRHSPSPVCKASTGPPSSPLARRAFHAAAVRRRDHHFDTLKFVQRLQDDGFTEDQSVAMMKVLNDVIEESIQNLTRTMVLREDAAKATYTQKVDFAKLRSELLSADSTETNTTRAAHERLANDLAKFNSRLRDEVGRTQASVRLDLNLEKGRIREEALGQELKVKETETKIEQEVAALRQQLEQVKFQTLQWLMGVCTGFAALMLGAWRLLM